MIAIQTSFFDDITFSKENIIFRASAIAKEKLMPFQCSKIKKIAVCYFIRQYKCSTFFIYFDDSIGRLF